MFKRITPFQFLLALFCLMSAYVVVEGNWKKTRYPLQMDANGYYVYLPALFIYHDLAHLGFVDNLPEQFDRKYFLYPGSQGGYMTKYTPGMAILEAPFFFVAHLAAPIFSSEQSGYSPPYRLAIAISTLFYTSLALWILSLLLARYFSRSTVLWTIGLLWLGTNLLFYSALGAGITHNYVFFTLVFTLFFGDRWIHKGDWQDFAWACAGVGMSTLIRPTEVLIGMIPVGFLISRWHSQHFQFKQLIQYWKPIVAGGITFFLFLIPILVYWKFATGNWVAYTYEQEGFYFDRPWQIWLGLFGFRKGWFIYTPLLFLSAWGMYYLWQDPRMKHFRASFWWYMPINLFIVLSWYGWWYGGCFGLRALIPALGLMAIPLAALLEKFKEHGSKIVIVKAMAVFFVLLNVFQSFQYQRRILHMDAMTWRSYAYIFGKWKLSEPEKEHVKTLLDYPDYNQRGKKLDEYFK